MLSFFIYIQVSEKLIITQDPQSRKPGDEGTCCSQRFICLSLGSIMKFR